MAIVVDSDTRLVVQGATGREGSFHTLRNRDYGTNVVAGVTPGKGGTELEGIPVFDTVAQAVEEAERVKKLLADRMIEDGSAWTDTKIVIRARKARS